MTDATATDEAGLGKPLSQLHSVLIPGETLEAWAIQRRLFALSHRRLLIAATSFGAIDSVPVSTTRAPSLPICTATLDSPGSPAISQTSPCTCQG